jgi:hypothetical protein
VTCQSLACSLASGVGLEALELLHGAHFGVAHSCCVIIYILMSEFSKIEHNYSCGLFGRRDHHGDLALEVLACSQFAPNRTMCNSAICNHVFMIVDHGFDHC